MDCRYKVYRCKPLRPRWQLEYKPSVFEGFRKCVIYVNSLFVAWCLGKGILAYYA